MRGEAVEAGGYVLVGGITGKGMDILVDEVGVLGVVKVDFVGLGLPVGGEDYYRFGLDLLGDLLANLLENGVDGVGGVVLNVGLERGLDSGCCV